MPWGLRICFGIFVIALLSVGGALVTKQPGFFPWDLLEGVKANGVHVEGAAVNGGTSVVLGWMFLGDAFYFLYALFRPKWANAAPQLWSFLAYDLVLIPPFINLLGTPAPLVEDGLLPYGLLKYNLTVYLGILFFSAMVAIYSLFIDRRTRIWS